MNGRLLTCLMTLLFSLNVFAQPAITIFTAKKIITMDPMLPEATAVAVKEGKVYLVGSVDEFKNVLKPDTYQINSQFANEIITPGLIEAHSHFTMLAIFMDQPYVGYWDFPGFHGTTLKAVKSRADVIARLKAADKAMTDPQKILFAWGYDPIFFNNEDLTSADLDSVSKTRPIFVLNASEHIGYVNSILLNKAGYNAQTTIPGVVKDRNGNPNGVLEEMKAAGPVIMTFFNQLFTPASFKSEVYNLADTAHNLGLTTYSEFLFGGPGENVMVDTLNEAANSPNFPARMVLMYDGALLEAMENKNSGSGIAHIKGLMKLNSPKLNFGGIKFVSDGSIQGFTGRLNWPGYFNGAKNGIFNYDADQLKAGMLPFWKAGFPLHVHVNGDQATDAALDAVTYLQNTSPRTPTAVTLEHDQMSNTEQFKRTHDLGMYANLFANHIYYWGDQHYSILLGPTRANTMDDAAEAKRNHVTFSLHSDSPVTPLGPLHSMWAAMNRVTVSGRVLGASEKISGEDALRAVTLNAAYLLGLERDIGSIEVGKRADFTVLAKDPTVVAPMTVKDIAVVATVVDGNVHLAGKGVKG